VIIVIKYLAEKKHIVEELYIGNEDVRESISNLKNIIERNINDQLTKHKSYVIMDNIEKELNKISELLLAQLKE
jgi:hypothetical protein